MVLLTSWNPPTPYEISLLTNTYTQVLEEVVVSDVNGLVQLLNYPFVEGGSIQLYDSTGAELTLGVDYNEDGDRGRIQMVNGPFPVTVTVTYWYWNVDINNKSITYMIGRWANTRMELMTGWVDVFNSVGTARDELYDWVAKKRIGFGVTGIITSSITSNYPGIVGSDYSALYTEAEPEYDPDILILENRPLLSVQQVDFVDIDGNVSKNIPLADIAINLKAGTLKFQRDRIKTGSEVVRVQYTTGTTDLDKYRLMLQQLIAYDTALEILAGLLGTDTRIINSYSLGALSVNKGEVAKKYLQQLGVVKQRRDELLELFGENYMLEVV